MTKRLGGLLAIAGLAALGCSSAAREAAPLELRFESGGITEILVIERKEGPPAQEAGGEVGRANPGPQGGLPGGELRARLDGREESLPLKRTDVKAQIALYVSAVTVTQQYHNPCAGTIEAVYSFPLPQDAAVREFVMTIGERRIRGIIREREEALKIYRAALRQGRTATLLTQDRPRVFTQRVANIEPGRRIDVAITYFHALRYAGGAYEFVFPLARPEGEVALDLRIDAGSPIESVSSPSHAILVERPAPGRARVTLDPQGRLPDRDFVLRYGTAGRGGLAAHRDETGGYFTLLLEPPADLPAASPALTDLRIDWGRMEVSDLHPDPLPDLFAGRPMIVLGRFRGRGTATIRVQGKAAGRPHETEIQVNLDEPALRHPALACLWARARIAWLHNQAAGSSDPDRFAEAIRQTALRYGLLSDFTAFITVDSLSERK